MMATLSSALPGLPLLERTIVGIRLSPEGDEGPG
jgi:hypothetical protein